MNRLKFSFSVAFVSMLLVLLTNCCVLADLVGHWKFDGDLTDSMGG